MTLISRLVFLTDKKTNQKSSDKIKIDEISIVIPVKDNQDGIDRYLTHFFKTHLPEKYPKEIIVVDNNSNPPIQIKKEHLKQEISLSLLTCSRKGPASARNLGAAKATGTWILFNDSDCIPSETLLTGYLSADNESIAYAGNIKAFHSDFISKYYETQEILIPLKSRNTNGHFFPQYLVTANTLIWKEAFDQIGGFRESIEIAGGEDIDLGLRLYEIGTLSYSFDSIAFHDFSGGLKEFLRRFKRYGQGNRLIEDFWQANLRPRLFSPNKKTPINYPLALLQFIALSHGYTSARKRKKTRVPT